MTFSTKMTKEEKKNKYYNGLPFGLNEVHGAINPETGNEAVNVDFPFGPAGEPLSVPSFKVKRFQFGIFSGLIWDVEDDWEFAEVRFDDDTYPADYLGIRNEVQRRTKKALTPVPGFQVIDGEFTDDAGLLYRTDLDNIKKQHEKSIAKRLKNLDYHLQKVEEAKADVKFQQEIIAIDESLTI